MSLSLLFARTIELERNYVGSLCLDLLAIDGNSKRLTSFVLRMPGEIQCETGKMCRVRN